MPSVTTISIQKKFALCITLLLLLLMGQQFAAYALKIQNCRKDEELVRLLRSYAKQISINAMKKIGAPLSGLVKYIYILYFFRCFILVGHFEEHNKTLKERYIFLIK